MRIALIAPLYEAVPPTRYGGTERVIGGLADELVRLGHDVTLYAAGESRTTARLVAATPAPLRTTMTLDELIHVAPHLHLKVLHDVYRRADEYDIIHAHTDLWTLPFIDHTTVPTVLTLHGRLDLDATRRVFPLYPKTPLVSISDSQREPLNGCDVRWAGTCYNGLPLDDYLNVAPGSGEYLAFVGRITPEKRPDWAVDVARRCGRPLKVAAKVDPMDVEYWHDIIEPIFDRCDVEFVGEIAESDKPEFFAGAKATLFPVDWPEPFGLVMIESLAAGTPVIALRNGSVPEVLDHGRTGLICSSLDEMVDAVDAIDGLDRTDCRTGALRFTARAMARRYVEIYEQVIGEARRDVVRYDPIRSTGAAAG